MSDIPEILVHHVAGRAMAFGFLWQFTREGSSEDHAPEAAKKVGANCFVLLNSVQYGLAQKPANGPRKVAAAVPALIARLSREFSMTWIGAWHLSDELYVVVEVIQDAISPDGDLVFADVSSARSHFESRLAVEKWQRVFAPSEWVIEGADERSLAKLCEETLPADLKFLHATKIELPFLDDPRIQRARKFALPIAAALTVSVSGIMGYSLWKHRFHKQAAVCTNGAANPPPCTVCPADTDLIDGRCQIARIDPPPVIPRPPSETAPSNLEFTRACLDALRNIVTALPARWNVESAPCSQSEAIVTLQRGKAGSATIDAVLGRYAPPEYTTEYSDPAERITVRRKIAGTLSQRTHEDLVHFDSERIRLYAAAQADGDDLHIQLPKKTEAAPEFSAPFITYDLTVDFNVANGVGPEDWASYLDRTPGIQFTQIKPSEEFSKWEIQGHWYVSH